MEDPAPFDLNEAIDRWRSQARRQSSLQAETVEELELHLLDTIRRLQAEGLSDQAAWRSASERLGEAAMLEREFAKLNRWKRKGRMAMAFLVSYFLFVSLLKGWTLVSLGAWAAFSGPFWTIAIPVTGLNFVCIVIPLIGIFRLLKREPPRWVAFGIGLATSSIVGLLLSKGNLGFEGMAGALACAAGLAVYVRYELTPLLARMSSGVWMAVGGAAFCGLMQHLFGPYGFRFPSDLGDWTGFVLAPVVIGLTQSTVVAPIGALLGVWLPARLRSTEPLRAMVIGSVLGAGIAASLLIFRHVLMDVLIRGTDISGIQLHEVRELTLNQAIAGFVIVVPSAALWVGLWAFGIAARNRVYPADLVHKRTVAG